MQVESTTNNPPAPADDAAKPVAPAVPLHLPARLARLDRALVALVVLLAFLLGSFAASNSDLLQQFAAGRLIAQGRYQFGVDPFTFTTQEGTPVYWANQSWLFGLVAYGLYSIPVIGGYLLVALKALVAALLAVVMLRASWRPGARWWVPGVLTALGLVALSPQLILRPLVVSLLMLGLTLWFLIRPMPQRQTVPFVPDRHGKGRPGGAAIPFQAYWPLPMLCLLWVNLDQWFLLGPITIALYTVGAALQDWFMPLRREAGEPVESPRTLTLVLLISVAACFLNPHTYHAFTLPPPFGIPAADQLADDPYFAATFLSPFSTQAAGHRYGYFREDFGLNFAGLSYFPLLLAGLVSFALTFGQWRIWRVLLWLFFAALSMYHARSIALFAVVAVPITALNFLDFAGRRGIGELLTPAGRSWALLGRGLTVLAVFLLAIVTVPGWLQARSGTPHARRVAWSVAFDPAAVEAAKQIAAWRQDEKLPAGVRWFNTSPDLVHFLSWYAPGERGFLDQRLGLFNGVVEAYLDARKSLQPGATEDRLPEVFGRHRIDHVICQDALPEVAPEVSRFLLQPARWQRIYTFGRIAMFRRTTVARADGLAVDDAALAFGPDAAAAPPRGPSAPPAEREWYDDFWKPQPASSPDLDDAWLHLAVFNNQVPTPSQQLDAVLQTRVIALAASGAIFPALGAVESIPSKDPPANPIELQAYQNRQAHLGQSGALDQGPPASLYLAIRAARRALHANPHEARAYLALGKAYFLLVHRTHEGRELVPRFPNDDFFAQDLAAVRAAQICANLRQAVRLDPNLMEAHDLLRIQYRTLNYDDLSAHHYAEYLRCLKQTPPPPQGDRRGMAGVGRAPGSAAQRREGAPSATAEPAHELGQPAERG